MNAHHEHEFEAAPGLPEPLPKGERLLWQGSPNWVQLALHAFHVRKLALYFVAMLAVQWLYLLGDPQAALLRPLLTSVVMASLALGLLCLTAWFSARTTLYSLTDRRVIMRVGIVLTLTFNLPLRQIAGASIKPYADGQGDIAIALKGEDRIAWLNLWPHARPWQLKRPEPSLRCLPDAAAVAARLQTAWQLANPTEQVVVGAEAAGVDMPLPVRVRAVRDPSMPHHTAAV
ncbi:photosynthetic complex putative assembly protein PuhB [Hydrogenophaga sp.]|uniref:photosynthetic complex putative assembly protein PuhB n=1 Tax=Hydrogenophaga sp. TaxID=1904254 RepID=UPI0025C38EB8|nr:photosynthetic complex putative assembly protein PuhB [Hydrogenophaga sp.]